MTDPASSLREVDVAVIGGGAAGLMAAMTAGARGRSVAVLEHNERLGKKILISGGGRCNFTNLGAAPENYLSAQPDFCKSALARYTPWHFVELVEKHGIAYHEKKLGQQFCDGSSREIVGLLEKECRDAGAALHLHCRVEQVARSAAGFEVATSQGTFRAAAVVVACGGPALPKIGATDFGHALARQFGLRLVAPRPGLVPLTWDDPGFPCAELSGLALPVAVRHGEGSFEEALLFTHRGVSGPAVLQISSYWNEGETLHFDLLPGFDAAEWMRENHGAKMELATLLSQRLPRRLAQLWGDRFASRPLERYKLRDLEEIGRLLNRWPLAPTGTEGYAKAEVTLGGVDTRDLSSKTFEARQVPGLYFVGEVVDVTGHLGGYNFQWAWASGHAAGEAV